MPRTPTQNGLPDPKHSDAANQGSWFRQQARARLGAGDAEGAIDLLLRAASSAGADDAVHLDLGRLLASRGDFGAALSCFERVVRANPRSLDARFLRGVTQLRVGQALNALTDLRWCAVAAPDDPSVRLARADAEFLAGADGEALAAIEAALVVRPDDEVLLLRKGEVLTRLARFDDALRHFQSATERRRSSAGLWMALAQAFEEAGEADQAERAYREALRWKDAWPQPLAGLLGLRRGDSSDAEIAMAQGLLHAGNLDAADTALLAYPLGRVHDARGEYPRAFECWRVANEAREREVGPLERSTFEAMIRRQLDAEIPRPAGIERSGDPSLVFVVGMPRSGTTLVEQVLDAHPDAAGCGELPFFAELAQKVPDAGSIDPLAARQLVETYLALASRHAAGNGSVWIDKAPLNALHLGHIARLFPTARVVWCRRDARDVALSIYSENFAKATRFATSLESIAACINAEYRLMRHWQRHALLPIVEWPYEAAVLDFERHVRTLLAFVGLSWSDACLAFHERKRVVQTPSRWQVRRPVGTGSVGRWRHYKDELGPLIRALDIPPDDDGVLRS